MDEKFELNFHILDKMSLGGVELATFDYEDIDLSIEPKKSAKLFFRQK